MSSKTLARRAAKQVSSLGGAPLRRLSLAGHLPPSVWKRLPVPGDFTVQGSHGSFRYLDVPNDSLARALHWRGVAGPEAETLVEFQILCQTADTFVDVGANTGLYSLLACATNPWIQVHAFEPVERIRSVLAANLAVNGWSGRVTPHDAALSNESGSTTLVVPTRTLPTSAHLDGAAYRADDGDRVIVPVARLDDLVDRVDLVKIDVEGAEDRVLGGMPRLLAECHPTILVECHTEGPYRAVDEILAASAYEFFHLTGNGPVKVARITPDPARRWRNFLCR